MFTGIIECVGEVVSAENIDSNLNLKVKSTISNELKIDQSVSHNGVCLTIVDQHEDLHVVQVVSESLKKSNLDTLQNGSRVNLERCLALNGRLDGHIVQGHVDETLLCQNIQDVGGSWSVSFELSKQNQNLIISKGSICINGVSLTIAELNDHSFSVAIIPFTFKNTIFNELQVNDLVNVEYDVLGKYVQRNMQVTNR